MASVAALHMSDEWALLNEYLNEQREYHFARLLKYKFDFILKVPKFIKRHVVGGPCS